MLQGAPMMRAHHRPRSRFFFPNVMSGRRWTADTAKMRNALARHSVTKRGTAVGKTSGANAGDTQTRANSHALEVSSESHPCLGGQTRGAASCNAEPGADVLLDRREGC